MFSWISKSFKRQVILILLGFVLLSSAIVIYDFYVSEKNKLNKVLVSQVLQLSHSLSLSVSSDVFYNNYYELSNDIFDVFEYNNTLSLVSGSLFNIANIAIVDKEDKIVGHSAPLNYPIGVKYTRIYETDKKKVLGDVEFVWNEERDYLFVRAPVKYNSSTIGYIHLDINPDFLSRSEAELINKILILMLYIIFVMFSFAWFFGNWVDKPLVDLIDKVEILGSGNIRFNSLIKRKDEFNVLALAIIEADKRIYQQNKQLLLVQKNLEKNVDKRTIELKEKAEELSNTLDDLKKYQKQIVEAEKMSALGSLVAGVSHEINTPVGVSLTGSTHIETETKIILDLLHNDGLGKKILKEYLEMVEEMSRSMCVSLLNAANLVRSFKQVAIDQHTELKRSFNLKAYCDEVLLSLHNKLTHVDVKVKNDIDDDIDICSYAGVFSQILTNFIINSLLHAFDDDVKNAEIIIRAFIEKNNLIFIYEDNGKGIDEENIDKIFDPFFTTKLGKGGSGLGLNIIYNLINHKLKGDIYCVNKERGIEMKITIPMKELSDE